jgi:hypothetical protein
MAGVEEGVMMTKREGEEGFLERFAPDTEVGVGA